MSDITTKFEDFKKKQKENKPLSDDITVLSKLDSGEYEPIKGGVDILQIIGVINDEKEIESIEKSIDENFSLDTSITVKDIKRGDIIYLTALLQKTKGKSFNSQSLGVVKARIVDYYIGISKLNQIKK